MNNLRLKKNLKPILYFFLGLTLVLSSFFSVGNEWYQHYNLEKIKQYSQKYQTTITFFQTSRFSTKPSITLIHGVGGSAQDFEAIINVLSTQYRLILVDLPNFGQSKNSTNIYSPNDYAKVLIDVLPSLVNKENLIIGHSMGGNISLQIALTKPELVKKLVLIDAAGFLNKFAYSKHIAGNYINDKFSFAKTYLPQLKSSIDKINRYLPDPSKLLLSEQSRKYLLNGNNDTIAALAVINEDLSAIIRQKAPPTLILWGKKDNVMPVQVADMLSYLLNTQNVYIFNDAGHSPQKQFPQQVANKITDFINELNSPPKRLINKVNKNIVINCLLKNNSELLNNAQYLSVTIKHCQNIRIDNLAATTLTVINSNISFTHLLLETNNNYAMALLNSNIEVWGGQLTGLSIAYIEKSELALNGVDLYSENALVVSNIPGIINASLTNIHLNKTLAHWHGIIDISF